MGTCTVRKAPTLDSAAWKKHPQNRSQDRIQPTQRLPISRLRPPLPGLNLEVANGENLQRMAPYRGEWGS
jgi:hypothetical protein